MRMIAGTLMLATSACMTPVGAEDPPVAGASGHRCDASAAQGLVGQQATSELGARALELTGARTIRWIQPGQAVKAVLLTPEGSTREASVTLGELSR